MEIISIEEAIAAGLKRYFTGVACKNGHISERVASKSRQCIQCSAEWRRKAYASDPVYRARRKQHSADHHWINRDKILAKGKERKKNNHDAYLQRGREWHQKNREAVSARRRAARNDETRRKEREARNIRMEKDPIFALRARIRSAIANGLSKSLGKKVRTYAKKPTEEILGCTFDEFKIHIERQFLKGMSWDNRCMWHIDHITPAASADTPEDLLALFRHTNLRPLWADQNRSKSDKLQFLI